MPAPHDERLPIDPSKAREGVHRTLTADSTNRTGKEIDADEVLDSLGH